MLNDTGQYEKSVGEFCYRNKVEKSHILIGHLGEAPVRDDTKRVQKDLYYY